MSSSSSSSASLSHPFTPVVLSVAALLFLASGWNTLSARRSQRIISSTKTTTVPIPITSKPTSSSTVQATYLVTPEMCAFPSPSLASSATQALPFVRSGPLLKLIDICAGISARRHSSHLCLTISLDAVLILKPIYLGELIHLSGSVNRAWNSSLEVGVRVMKENESGQKEYVCHAYLTFVAVNKDPKGTGNGNEKEKVKLSTINPISRIEKRRHLTAGLRRNKRIADAKKGETRDGVSKEIKEMVKKEVLKLGESRDCGKEDHGIAADEVDKEKGRVENDEIDRFELELIARAYQANDPAISIDRTVFPNQVIVSLPGDEPLRRGLLEVEKEVQRHLQELSAKLGEQQGTAGGRRVSMGPVSPALETNSSFSTQSQACAFPTFSITGSDGKERQKIIRSTTLGFENWETPFVLGGGVGIGLTSPTSASASSSIPDFKHPPNIPQNTKPIDQDPPDNSDWLATQTSTSQYAILNKVTEEPSLNGNEGLILIEKTLVKSIHLVFPEHANSASVLFGGQLISWMESCALLSAIKLHPSNSASFNWSTVSMDGLEFHQPAHIGEVLEFVSVVVRTFSRSCEVYVMALKESKGKHGGRTICNDILMTMASSGNGGGRGIKGIEIDEERLPALKTFASVADGRRESRLEMRRLLSSIYK